MSKLLTSYIRITPQDSSSGWQALLMLVYLRKGETFAELAAGLEVRPPTARRYLNETVALLAGRATPVRRGRCRVALKVMICAGRGSAVSARLCDGSRFTYAHRIRGTQAHSELVAAFLAIFGRGPSYWPRETRSGDGTSLRKARRRPHRPSRSARARVKSVIPLPPRRSAAVRASHRARMITQRDISRYTRNTPARYGMARE
jgi:hypothetical protein